MNFSQNFAPAPFDKVPIVISATWLIVSAGLMLFPRQLVGTVTRGTIKLPLPAVWACRILGVFNLVGAIYFLIVFQR